MLGHGSVNSPYPHPKASFFSGLATERGGGKTLVAEPLKNNFFCGFPKMMKIKIFKRSTRQSFT